MLESLFNKVTGLQTWNLLRKRLWHRCFSLNIAKLLKIIILKNICKKLLFPQSNSIIRVWELDMGLEFNDLPFTILQFVAIPLKIETRNFYVRAQKEIEVNCIILESMETKGNFRTLGDYILKSCLNVTQSYLLMIII